MRRVSMAAASASAVSAAAQIVSNEAYEVKLAYAVKLACDVKLAYACIRLRMLSVVTQIVSKEPHLRPHTLVA